MPDQRYNFPATWKLAAVEDCMSAIIDYRGKSPKKTVYGIPLITAKIVKNGRIEEPHEFIAVEDYGEWMRRGIPKQGDVLMTTEAPLGEIAQLDDRRVALAQRLLTLRGKPGFLDNKFLKFLMQSEFVQSQLRARATGTTVLGIRQSELRRVLLPIPPIEEQHAIGIVLGALDDKIELNQRMNETLEAIARAIFRSWFMEVESSRRSRRCYLGEFAEAVKDQVKPENVPPENPYIGLEHLPRKRIALENWGKANEVGSNKFKFRRGDILFGKLRPYFHKVGVAPIDGVCSTDILVIRPKSAHCFGFVLGHLSSDELIAYADAGSTGTKMPRTSWEELSRFEIPSPPADKLMNFERIALPMVEKIIHNIHESRTLAVLRETLLPKLISGEIRIKQAGKTVEAHA